jgi:hypothetical protein
VCGVYHRWEQAQHGTTRHGIILLCKILTLHALLLLLLQSDTSLASRLFTALGAEPPGSRSALQEALGGMAAAMTAGIQAGAAAGGDGAAAAGGGGAGGLPPSKVEELERLLLSSIGSEQVRAVCKSGGGEQARSLNSYAKLQLTRS